MCSLGSRGPYDREQEWFLAGRKGGECKLEGPSAVKMKKTQMVLLLQGKHASRGDRRLQISSSVGRLGGLLSILGRRDLKATQKLG